MAKKARRGHRWIFPVCLVLYAVLFLFAANEGLQWFWGYMDAYEQTRPHIALNAYKETLTKEYVAAACENLVAQIDHHVQSEESCRQVILDALNEPLTCAKKSRESTEDKYVYAILCGETVVGTMEMERCGAQIQGFIPWVVTKDSFDLSYLITEPVSATVPSTFSVYVNESLLSSDYITQDNIHYSKLEDFYDTYSLPHMVTYQAGPFLGTPTMTLADPSGKEITQADLEDPSCYISNCTDDETAALDTIAGSFIRSYVAFTSRTGGDNYRNYLALKEFMVTDGELSKRMYAALDGLSWISDRGAVLSELDIHHYIHVGEGRYLCDLTYVVDTNNHTGSIQSISSLWVFFVQTENGLRAESMLSY